MKKRFFIEILKEICAEEKLNLEIFCHEWMCKITDKKTGQHTWTEGYNFNLNSAVNYLTLYDKVLTSCVLQNGGVATIENKLILKEDWRICLEIQKTAKSEVGEILKEFSLPVVVKINNGSQGNGVYLCETEKEVENIVDVLKTKQSLAISKYYESKFEYRFYILDGEILFAYKKIRNGSWQHNLSKGATAQLIEKKYSLYLELKKLALQAFKVLDLCLAAVDILDTEEGLKVIEVNNGIMMDGFAAINSGYYKIAKETHRKILLRTLYR